MSDLKNKHDSHTYFLVWIRILKSGDMLKKRHFFYTWFWYIDNSFLLFWHHLCIPWPSNEFPIGFSFNKKTQNNQDSRIFKLYYLPIGYIFSVNFMFYHIDITPWLCSKIYFSFHYLCFHLMMKSQIPVSYYQNVSGFLGHSSTPKECFNDFPNTLQS